jgi:threonine/homoserine/homoserine lactone efflux protein
MLMASGLNFGFRQTIPHILGIGVGFTVMVALVGIGLTEIFYTYPASFKVLHAFSIVYLLYLAFKVATAAPALDQSKPGQSPLTFVQAALFQWVNPKAWTMALTAISIYSPSRSYTSVLFTALIFGMINAPSVSVWALLGEQLCKFLSNPRAWRIFNFTMAALLVGSIYFAVGGNE